jgi:hypothetical protein
MQQQRAAASPSELEAAAGSHAAAGSCSLMQHSVTGTSGSAEGQGVPPYQPPHVRRAAAEAMRGQQLHPSSPVAPGAVPPPAPTQPADPPAPAAAHASAQLQRIDRMVAGGQPPRDKRGLGYTGHPACNTAPTADLAAAPPAPAPKTSEGDREGRHMGPGVQGSPTAAGPSVEVVPAAPLAGAHPGPGTAQTGPPTTRPATAASPGPAVGLRKRACPHEDDGEDAQAVKLGGAGPAAGAGSALPPPPASRGRALTQRTKQEWSVAQAGDTSAPLGLFWAPKLHQVVHSGKAPPDMAMIQGVADDIPAAWKRALVGAAFPKRMWTFVNNQAVEVDSPHPLCSSASAFTIVTALFCWFLEGKGCPRHIEPWEVAEAWWLSVRKEFTLFTPPVLDKWGPSTPRLTRSRAHVPHNSPTTQSSLGSAPAASAPSAAVQRAPAPLKRPREGGSQGVQPTGSPPARGECPAGFPPAADGGPQRVQEDGGTAVVRGRRQVAAPPTRAGAPWADAPSPLGEEHPDPCAAPSAKRSSVGGRASTTPQPHGHDVAALLSAGPHGREGLPPGPRRARARAALGHAGASVLWSVLHGQAPPGEDPHGGTTAGLPADWVQPLECALGAPQPRDAPPTHAQQVESATAERVQARSHGTVKAPDGRVLHASVSATADPLHPLVRNERTRSLLFVLFARYVQDSPPPAAACPWTVAREWWRRAYREYDAYSPPDPAEWGPSSPRLRRYCTRSSSRGGAATHGAAAAPPSRRRRQAPAQQEAGGAAP